MLVPIGVTVMTFLFWASQSRPLSIVSSDPNLGVAVRCTFGTNHVYSGDFLDRLMTVSPGGMLRRWSQNQTTSRPQPVSMFSSPQPSTAVWVRLQHQRFGKVATQTPVVPIGAVLRFRGVIKHPSTGIETILEHQSLIRQYNRRSVTAGFLLHGGLDAYRGGVLRIEATNGDEVVTFRIR